MAAFVRTRPSDDAVSLQPGNLLFPFSPYLFEFSPYFRGNRDVIRTFTGFVPVRKLYLSFYGTLKGNVKKIV